MKLIHANVSVLLVAMLLGAPLTSWAQESAKANELRTYGTKDATSHTLSAWAFTGYDADHSARFRSNAKASRYCTGGSSCAYLAPLMLPEGARLQFFELDACNTGLGTTVKADLLQLPATEGTLIDVASVSFPTPPPFLGEPACQLIKVSVSPQTINNFANSYFVQVAFLGDTPTLLDGNTRFSAVRVYYSLQVSPAPATATFNDVPTNHGFFPFIEALAAAGITGGCSVSPPLYCPDNAVTRGQMAVFISRALGLHFAP